MKWSGLRSKDPSRIQIEPKRPRSLCSATTTNRKPCGRAVAAGAERCWQHSHGLKQRWHALTGRQSGVVTAVGTLVGIVSLLLTLLPSVKVEVRQTTAFNPSHPADTRFAITNSGTTLHGVQTAIGLRSVWYGPRLRVSGSDEYKAEMCNEVGFDLNSGETHEVPCRLSEMAGIPGAEAITAADFAVIVHFRASWRWWRDERKFRFVTVRDSSGQLVLVQKALSYKQPSTAP
jgi:hypothetical protein